MTNTYRTAPARPEEKAVQLSPIANLDTLFPRPHPLASTVRLLGVLALATGPLAGVPAILLWRIVEREAATSNGRITGAPRLFVRLGWAGTVAGVLLTLVLCCLWLLQGV